MKIQLFLVLVLIFISSCIGTDVIDDFVPEKVEITNPIMSLKVGDTYDLMFRYLNNVGDEGFANVLWLSKNEDIISVNEKGVLTAENKGSTVISVILASNDSVMDEITVDAADETVVLSSGIKNGTIATTSSYQLEGDFEIENIDDGVRIDVKSNYIASDALPGLYVYLSNNPTTVDGALEISEVTVFSGEHTYNVTDADLTVDTYAYLLYFCKPFNVKVGHGEILD